MNNPLISHLLDALINLDKSFRVLSVLSSDEHPSVNIVLTDMNRLRSAISSTLDELKSK